MRRLFYLVFLAGYALMMGCTTAGAATTYYIASSGSDTNNGTNSATPWQHAPGMRGCSSSCSSANPQPGDRFILRGGDTWGSNSFAWNWSWAGSPNNFIYIGVDQSYFSGSSWHRPILNCQGSCKQQLYLTKTSNYVQLDNLEFTGLFDSETNPQQSVWSINAHDAVQSAGSNAFLKVSNNYFHGWNIAHDGTQGALIILWGTGAADSQSEVYSNVADGSDAAGGAPHVMCFLYGSPGKVYNNYAGHMSNGYINGSSVSGGGSWVRSFHDNLIEYIFSSVDGATHENMFESIGDGGTVAYNNLVRHGQFSGLVVFELAPYKGVTSYAFNNVLYDIYSPNGQQCYENSPAGGTCYFFNNTSQCGALGSSNISCGRSTGVSVSHFINEHFITSAPPIEASLNGSTITSVTQTEAAANSQGYNSQQTYAFSPTGQTVATASTSGTNSANLCSAIAALDSDAGAACRNDTTYSCIYSTSEHTMNCPSREPVARATTAAWNVGAYDFGQVAGSPTPKPPSGLTATVQ